MKRLFTLSFSLFAACTTFAQIPNASFENWTHVASGGSAGYDMPTSWGNANTYTSIDSSYTCEKGTAAPPAGSSFIKLTSKTIVTPLASVVVPGIAVTGTVSYTPPSTYGVSGGFPFTSRPANLTGQWQYMASGFDHGQIVVFLSHWNSAANRKDTISFTNYALPGMQMTWASFSIPLSYSSQKYPDTAMIILSSSSTSSPTAGSYLYVDTLAFTGNVPSSVITVVNDHAATTIYPNPARGMATLYYYSLFSGETEIRITDVCGKVVKKMNFPVTTGSNDIPLNIAGLIRGVYFVDLWNGMGKEVEKLIVE